MNSTLGRTTHVVLRVGIALLFFSHGLQKFGYLGGMAGPCETCSWTAVGGTAAQIGLTRLVVAGWMEIVGGILLLAGALTRPVAFVLFLEMVVAFVMVHAPRGGSPMQNAGEIPLLYALVFLFLAGVGGGPFSVDERLQRK